jgi:prolyl-tRNA editing enzyme YbaK/EbsC (Cys-tRNA(Pro) deacylase)
MTDSTPAGRALDALSIPYRLFRHSKPPDSLEQAATQRGQLPDQVIRSILFRLGKNDFVLVLAAGPTQLSWPKLRARLGVSRLSLASETEVLKVSGAAIGAVGPLGLPVPVPLLADEGVFLPEEVSIGSGVRGAAVILKTTDVKRALGQVDIARLT